MPLPASLLKLAAAVLPTCKTLSDAELKLGGEFQGEGSNRDWDKTARIWGIFDGWNDRPAVWSESHQNLKSAYMDAYYKGRAMAIDGAKPK